MDYQLLFPGRFLKAADFRGKVVPLTIVQVRTEDLPQDKGGNKVKGIIRFAETKKELVLNRTNAECMVAMFGRDTDNWIGHKVSLFPSTWNGDPAIRVKGSPELERPLPVTVKLPRRNPLAMVMEPTGKRQPQQNHQPAQEPHEEGNPTSLDDAAPEPASGLPVQE